MTIKDESNLLCVRRQVFENICDLIEQLDGTTKRQDGPSPPPRGIVSYRLKQITTLLSYAKDYRLGVVRLLMNV